VEPPRAAIAPTDWNAPPWARVDARKWLAGFAIFLVALALIVLRFLIRLGLHPASLAVTTGKFAIGERRVTTGQHSLMLGDFPHIWTNDLGIGIVTTGLRE
jgi:hypothetical protein